MRMWGRRLECYPAAREWCEGLAAPVEGGGRLLEMSLGG